MTAPSRRARAAAADPPPSAWWRGRAALVAGGVLLFLVLLVVIGYATTTIPKPSQLASGGGAEVTYSDGGVIGRIPENAPNRILVPLSSVPVPVQKAVLAAEDRQFYSEPGISPRGIIRAILANLRGGGVQQGGSTITQQYAKNAFLTQQRTFTRKIREIFISLKLAHSRSKDSILQDYLNTIYFGRGAYGIQAASRAYFGKDVSRLDVAEGAVLAASIRAPTLYEPTRHPERATSRWDYVLDGMVKSGWLAADRRPTTYPHVLPEGRGTGNGAAGPSGYILDQVREELARRGFDEAVLASGGYTVQTTIRRQAQDAAVRAVQAYVHPGDGGQFPVQGALAAIKPGTGEVFAYYGGRKGSGALDYASNPAGVQPGSSMKPYVLAAALEQGISLQTKVDGSSPQSIDGQQVSNDQGDPPMGQVDLVTATALSVNTAYYNLTKQVGPDKVADLAHRAGIPAQDKLYRPGENGDRPTLGITLGIYNVRPIDQATGFATFAGQGQEADPFFVKRVTDRQGQTVYSGRSSSRRAFGADVAADATYAMQQVVQSGTGTRAQLSGRPTAGKTGTTSSNTNAWFCGFTPNLAAAVWIGREQGKELRGVLGSSTGVYGGTVPAEIFKAFMDAALQGQPVLQFPPPAHVGGVPTTSASVATQSPTPSPTATSSPSPSPVVTVVPPVQDTGNPVPPPPSPTATDTGTPAPSPTASTSPAAAQPQAQPSG